MLICYSERWLAFLLFRLRSPRQSLSFCSVNSWFRISAGSHRDGDQVQLGLLSKERVHSKAALQMGSPCYAPGDPHGAGVQESPASLPSSLFYLPVSPGLAEGMETLPWPLPARDHFCVSLSRTAAGSPLRPGGSVLWNAGPTACPWGDALYIILPLLPVLEASLRGCCLYYLLIFASIEVASACGCLLISDAQMNTYLEETSA